MKTILKRRPSGAMIVAIIALVAALAGTAVADSGFLTTKKFKKQAVRGPVTYATSNVSVPNTNGANSPGFHVTATCPAGTHVIGGGIKLALEADMFVNDSYPTTSGWAGTIYNSNPAAQTATVTAICATSKRISGAPPAA